MPIPATAAHPARRHDLDWLRVVATYLLFVFHVAKVFDPAPFYHIRNADLSPVMMVLAGFISLWHMPLFFLLAGWSAHASLEARGGGAFVRERVLKLWIPLAMGCVLLMPPIKYVELRSGLDLNAHGLTAAPHLQEGFKQLIPGGLPVAAPFVESFGEFLPTFFTRLDRFTWAHLWFLAYLLAFTLLYLPLFGWLRRDRRRFAPTGALWVYAPIVPLALVQVALRPRWPGIQNLYDDWANFAYFSIFLIAGFLLARHPDLERLVRSEWRRALGVGVAAAGVLLLAVLGVVTSPAALLAGSAVAGWCFVVALVGTAHRFLSFTNRAHRYLVESAFPVYVLHQSTIVLLGYFLVLDLPLGIAAKFGLLLALSTATTLAVYELLVRHVPLLRFLFAMKARGPRAPAIPAAARAAAALLLALAAGAPVARTWAESADGARAPSARTASPLGLWYAEGGAAQVEIRHCGDGLCGRVAWLRAPLDEDGCELRDAHNPDERLRRRPVVGIEILRDLTPAAGRPDAWSGGEIYDPGTGNTYRVSATLDGESRLSLRGYLGIPLFGRTTRWIRVGTEGRLCRARS